MTFFEATIQKSALVSALERWRSLYAEELARVDEVIFSLTESEASLIPMIVRHIVASGGKRLRPVLLILAARLCGYSGERHVNLAACVEFLHTATLLHDDVVDESKLRRGVRTANETFGNQASVLVGDFLLSRSFQLMARDGSLEVLRILSEASAVITEGEVKQLMAVSDLSLGEARYVDIIASKTAKLFEAACEIGAILGECGESERRALTEFGCNLGIAFQIADDVLDYSAEQQALGKTIGDDFREGKVTLPVILAYAKGGEQQFWEEMIEGAPEKQNPAALEKAIGLIRSSGALQHTIDIARRYMIRGLKNLEVFPEKQEKQALQDLIEFSVERLF